MPRSSVLRPDHDQLGPLGQQDSGLWIGQTAVGESHSSYAARHAPDSLHYHLPGGRGISHRSMPPRGGWWFGCGPSPPKSGGGRRMPRPGSREAKSRKNSSSSAATWTPGAAGSPATPRGISPFWKWSGPWPSTARSSSAASAFASGPATRPGPWWGPAGSWINTGMTWCATVWPTLTWILRA